MNIQKCLFSQSKVFAHRDIIMRMVRMVRNIACHACRLLVKQVVLKTTSSFFLSQVFDVFVLLIRESGCIGMADTNDCLVSETSLSNTSYLNLFSGLNKVVTGYLAETKIIPFDLLYFTNHNSKTLDDIGHAGWSSHNLCVDNLGSPRTFWTEELSWGNPLYRHGD